MGTAKGLMLFYEMAALLRIIIDREETLSHDARAHAEALLARFELAHAPSEGMVGVCVAEALLARFEEAHR